MKKIASDRGIKNRRKFSCYSHPKTKNVTGIGLLKN